MQTLRLREQTDHRSLRRQPQTGLTGKNTRLALDPFGLSRKEKWAGTLLLYLYVWCGNNWIPQIRCWFSLIPMPVVYFLAIEKLGYVGLIT